jgi:poly(beta-D-mannuronate) lyase
MSRLNVIVVLALCGIVSTRAAVLPVSSLDELRAGLAKAKPGDRVVLKNGVYSSAAAIEIACAGSESAPIVIAAESVGGAEIHDGAGFKFVAPAAFVSVEGFVFKRLSATVLVGEHTAHCRLTRNRFEVAGKDVPFITVAGDDAEISHNDLGPKSTVGNMISVIGPGSDQMAQRLWVHHNYFHDFQDAHGNGAETIRLGLSGRSMADAHALVEQNLFVRCDGELELISNKSCANTYRYNTFRDSTGQFTLRHGNYCLVYGNYFINTRGIRFFGDHHKIYSNYFTADQPAILVGNGDGEVADGAKLTCHDRPDFCEISYNTLVDNRENVVVAGRAQGLGATHVTFANNIIQGGPSALKIDMNPPQSTWRDNLIWQTEAGQLPEGSYHRADPKLAKNAAGVYHLQAGSVAIGAGQGPVPSPAFDLDGQKRDDAPDIGADEYSDLPAVAHPLSEKEVGPSS